jgi:3-hydroxymyristoyl/3-hydroxydecanoyl-(acyl carrier protein) dehydratase
VLPGDQLLLNVTITARKGPVWKMHGEARVGDALVAEADLMATIRDAFVDKSQEGAGK